MDNLLNIKGLFILFLGLFAFTSATNAPDKTGKVTGKKEIMIKKINEMNDRFMQYRSKTSQIYMEQGWNSKEMADNEVLMRESDATNYQEAKALFNNYGLPVNSLVGEELAHKYWLIVLNCNDDSWFQTGVLKAMYLAMEENDISTSDYAFLADRIRINRGKTQIYGTQIKYNEKASSYEPYEIRDEKNVDQRRVLMGLAPIKKYMQEVNQKYQKKAKRMIEPRKVNKRI